MNTNPGTGADILQTTPLTRPRSMSMPPASTEPTVRSIIRAARSVNAPASSRRSWIAAGLSGLLLWASFSPLDWGALGWIALVPLLLLVRPAKRPPRAALATFVTTFVSQIFILQWLRYGDPSMYVAMVACAFYFACYFPTFLLLCRGAVHRLRVPLVIAAPIIWVGWSMCGPTCSREHRGTTSAIRSTAGSR